MHPDSGRKNPMRWRKGKDGEHELLQEGVFLAVVSPIKGHSGRWAYRTLCCGNADVDVREDPEDWCHSADSAKSQAMSWVRQHRVRYGSKHRACPRCQAHVAVPVATRPAIGRCFGCGHQYSVWADESVNALCACGVAHDEGGHPYTVGEARRYFDAHGDGMEEYQRHLFAFLLEKAEAGK